MIHRPTFQVLLLAAFSFLGVAVAQVPAPTVATAQEHPTRIEGNEAKLTEEAGKTQGAASLGETPALQEELGERFESLMKLFTTREVEKILAEFVEPFQITSPTADAVTNKESLEKYFTDIYKKDVGFLQRINIKPDDVTVTALDKDHALISATSDDVYISREGYEYKTVSQWNATARRVDGEWKFVTMSHTTDVLRNPMYLQAVDAARLRPLVSGLVGLIVGVIGGWAFFTLRRSTKNTSA
ncbi:hypothetical protein IT570_13875 [Candidatus Sumerlaeota bacterium]|nr:hypothetical protein [Candidatus Sumerlaeota bacterium]